MKNRNYQRPLQGFKPIHMPRNTGAGIILSGFATAMGFGLIWHMWLLVGASFIALIGGAIFHTFNYKRDFHIPVDQVINTEAERTKLLAAQAAS
jgi:cytochrome o ubiquinol oxidase subunit 1